MGSCGDIVIKNFANIVAKIACIANNSVIPLLFSVALMVFVGSAVTYILSGRDEKKKSAARKYLLWGVIGIFVMVGIWGILLILTNTLDINNFALPQFKPGQVRV